MRNPSCSQSEADGETFWRRTRLSLHHPLRLANVGVKVIAKRYIVKLLVTISTSNGNYLSLPCRSSLRACHSASVSA